MSEERISVDRNKEGAGKGDRYRPVDSEKYRKGWEMIFGQSKRKKGINK